MVLLGRFLDAADGLASFAPDLQANLAAGDESFAGFIRMADEYAGDKLPVEAVDTTRVEVVMQSPRTLDLQAANIGAVIWATGYRYDFNWVDLDIFGSNGSPTHRRGVTAIPGVYFLGLPYLHKTKSSFLSGVGEDAAYLAEQIAMRRP